MKIKGILFATLSLFGVSGAFAQGVEYDDMYFNSEDRAKLNAQRETQVVYNTPSKTKFDDMRGGDERLNPTDSYSARNVNPEYTSRADTQSAQTDNEDYFVNNYQYNRNQYNNWNNNFDNWYNNPWYRNNYYGPGMYSWRSPYYGYNSWNNPWYDPVWGYNGWSSSLSFHYGWGGSYGWNRPYYGWDPYYGGLGYYGGGYWNNWMYPRTIVVVNGGEHGRDVVHGKRSSRGTSYVSERNAVRSRSADVESTGSRLSSTGRTSTTKQAEYYNRYNQAQRSSNNSFYNRQSTQNNRSSSWSNDNYSRSGRTSSPSYSTPSRSSSSSYSGGSRSSSSGSGTNGRSRGSN